MPDRPYNGGTFRIQSKATNKQLDLPVRSDSEGVFNEKHIVPRDQGVVWQIEDFIEGAEHYFRFKTRSVFPWFETTDYGRLDSNLNRQVYAHEPNEGHYQMWQPEPLADGYFLLTNVATGFVLDGTDRDIYTHTRNYGSFQRWGFFAAAPEPFPLEVEGASTPRSGSRLRHPALLFNFGNSVKSCHPDS